MIETFVYGDLVLLDPERFSATYFGRAEEVFIDCLKETPDAFAIINAANAYQAQLVTASVRGADCRNFLLCIIPEVQPIDYRSILGYGADQLVQLDIDPSLLEATISAVRRRGNGYTKNVVEKGDFSFDLETGELRVAGSLVKMSTQEAKVLRAMVMSQGRIISTKQIHEKLYGFDEDAPDIKIIDVYVCKIRRKIDRLARGIDFIETNWGRGYRFNIDGIRSRYRSDVLGRRQRIPETEERRAALAERRQAAEAAAE